MNEQTTTINLDAKAQQPGINKYELLQSISEEIVNQYKQRFQLVEGSLTTVVDNDTATKMNIAMATLDPNQIQTEILLKIEESFKSVENAIDPDRLNFAIYKAEDNEICLYRRSSDGISNIIINDDGLTAYSFIAFKNTNKDDILEFYEEDNSLDCEHLAFKFFSL